MLNTRFSTRLAARAMVLAVTAGAALLIGGVANAATPGTVTAAPIIGDPSDDTGALDPGQILDPVLGGLLGGSGGLDPGQLLGGTSSTG